MSKERPVTNEELLNWANMDVRTGGLGYSYNRPTIGSLESYHPALQGLRALYFNRDTNVAGYVPRKSDEQSQMYLNRGSSLYKATPLETKLHEADHLRENRSGTSKFDTWMKNITPLESALHPNRFTQRVLKNKDLLEKKYPGITKSAYFSDKGVPDFSELMAELSSYELATGRPLTADPELRKAIFNNDPKAMELYNSMSNWRTTRWDARDLRPYEFQKDLVPSTFDTLVDKIKRKK